MQGKDKEFNPFAVNFRKLQTYNHAMPLEERIMFEYFMLLAQNFGYKQFYHSTAAITKETGIKRTKIESIIKKFQYNNILDVETKGFPVVKHFTVNIGTICELLPNIYQFAGNDKLYADICKLYAEIYNKFTEINSQENINTRNIIKETKKQQQKRKRGEYASHLFSDTTIRNYITGLEEKYNDRRNYIAKNKGKKNYPHATLGFKNEVFENAKEAYSTLGEKLIHDAWLVFNDKIVNKEISATKLLPYFFSKKDNSFDVINSMADIHNTSYSFT